MVKRIKNIYDWVYTNGIKKIHWIGILMLSSLSITIGFVTAQEHGFIWGTLISISIFLVFIWKLHVDDNYNENHRIFIEDKYGSDPEWKKYKELKRKFNNS